MVIKVNKNIYTNVSRFHISKESGRTIISFITNGVPIQMKFFKEPTIEAF